MNGPRRQTPYREGHARCHGWISPGGWTEALRTRVESHFWWLWAFVGLVSVYDAWLVVVFRDLMPYMEQNPVGLALIKLDPGGLSYFLVSKAVGTTIVLLALIQVHRWLHRYREVIIGGVASCQAWLLFYLSLS